MVTAHSSRARPGGRVGPAAPGHRVLAIIERRLGLTSSGLIVAGCAVFGAVLGKVVFSSRAVLLLVYGVLFVVAAAYVMGRRRLALTMERSELPSRVREGKSVTVGLTLHARRGVSTILLEEALPESFGQTVVMPVSILPAGQEMVHHYTFTPKLRGVYTIGPLTAVWSDPFGLTRHRLQLAEPTRIVVHPMTERVADRVISREWEDPPIRPPISRRWPTGFEFYGMRDYVSGDDPRRIVWRATAKTLDTQTGEGRYLVREAEQGITDQVFLILDNDRAQHSPGTPSATFETAVRAVASLGVRHLRDGFSVTVEGNADQLALALRGRRSEVTLLDHLAGVGLVAEPNARAVERLLTNGRRNAHYVLVTPYVSRNTATRLRLLLDRGTSLLLVLILWDETDPLSMHRAAGLGCNVVELRAGMSMDRAFQRISFVRGVSAGGAR
jgi:uncharacterized protein (DUF58 family)